MCETLVPTNNGAIIFDCDGVIFDSNDLKSQAFYQALSDYPEQVRTSFVNYHKAYGGISRYVKFQYLFNDILKQDVDEVKLKQLLSAFGRSCRELYEDVPLTAGCYETLQKLSSEGWALYIASGSDEAELRDVFEARGLSGFFKKILGSPKPKLNCISEALSFGNHVPALSLMVGDAVADWQAAKGNKVDCILMTDYSEAQLALQKLSFDMKVPLISNLTALHTLLG